jgi:exodeoxyribonuclease VII large subunit
VVPDLAEEVHRLEIARGRLNRTMTVRLDRDQAWLDAARSRPALAKPEAWLDQRSADAEADRERARRYLAHRLDGGDADVRQTRARVRSLSPLATLERGYAVVQHADGGVVRRAQDVSPGEALRIRLAEGEVTAETRR